MTEADLVFLGGQFHFAIDRNGAVQQAEFRARIGIKAPVGVPDEFKDIAEEKRVESVEIRINKSTTVLANAVAALVPKAKTQALGRFAPIVPPLDQGGEAI